MVLAMSPWLISVFHHRTSGKRKTPVILITCIGLLGNVKRQLFQSSNVTRMIKADSNGRSMLSALRKLGNGYFINRLSSKQELRILTRLSERWASASPIEIYASYLHQDFPREKETIP